MWARIFIFSFILLPLSAKIVSLDLCADQWVLRLAHKKDIHAVSYLAHDPELSYEAAAAANVPTHKGAPEDFLNPAIKTIIGYEPISPLIKKICQKKGITLISLSYPRSLSELKKQITQLARFFHQKDIEKEWIQQLTFSPLLLGRTAAFYGAHGLCPGTQTLLNDVLQASGYTNLYRSKKGWTYNPLESLLVPSLSALFFTDPPSSHPLWQWMQNKNVILKTIPYRLTLCPYPPAILDLVKLLKESSHA